MRCTLTAARRKACRWLALNCICCTCERRGVACVAATTLERALRVRVWAQLGSNRRACIAAAVIWHDNLDTVAQREGVHRTLVFCRSEHVCEVDRSAGNECAKLPTCADEVIGPIERPLGVTHEGGARCGGRGPVAGETAGSAPLGGVLAVTVSILRMRHGVRDVVEIARMCYSRGQRWSVAFVQSHERSGAACTKHTYQCTRDHLSRQKTRLSHTRGWWTMRQSLSRSLQRRRVGTPQKSSDCHRPSTPSSALGCRCCPS